MFELRQAVRALWSRRAYAVAGIATLALVIGVNAALFAAINATLFRPVPLKSGYRTVSIYLMPPGVSDPKYRNPLHAIDLVRFRERSRTLTHFAAFTTADRVLASGGEPAVVNTVPVSAEMLRLAAEGPILGRLFTDDEETRKERLIVLSYGAWQRRFGGDVSIVGRSVQLDNRRNGGRRLNVRHPAERFLHLEHVDRRASMDAQDGRGQTLAKTQYLSLGRAVAAAQPGFDALSQRSLHDVDIGLRLVQLRSEDRDAVTQATQFLAHPMHVGHDAVGMTLEWPCRGVERDVHRYGLRTQPRRRQLWPLSGAFFSTCMACLPAVRR